MTIENTLIQFEKELHTSLTRSNEARLSELLAPEFYEFGSSGNIWSREDILTRLPAESKTSELKIESRNYKVSAVAADIYLVTYVSYRDVGGKEERTALRSSLWKQYGSQWKMVFHQGTFSATV